MSFDYQKYLPDFTTETEIKIELRKKICDYLGSQYACLVTNGTDAIEIALRALKLPRGSHVMLPDLSYIATATAIAHCGLIPLYCDIDENYFGLSYDSLVRNYNSDVKAVIVVHFAGYVHRDIFEIKDFCESRGLYLIEDCAQAFPCSIDGKRVGTIGDIGTCSFQSSKILNSGEGGLIVTDSGDIARMLEIISDWGMFTGMTERDLSVASSNYRMSAVQAYFLIKQLDMIDEIVLERLAHTSRLADYITAQGIEVSSPPALPNVVDCPFFLPIKSTVKFNTAEPRLEYPMRKSVLVKSIISQLFPDLLTVYEEINAGNDPDCICEKVIMTNDFINIANYGSTSFDIIMEPYLKIAASKN